MQPSEKCFVILNKTRNEMKQLLAIALVLCGLTVSAQDYNRAFGVRVGYTSGIEFKKFYNDIAAVNLLMTFQRGGTQLYIIQQFNHPFLLRFSDQLFIYYGCGLHVGYTYWSNEHYTINGNSYRMRANQFGIGFDGSLGLEYHAISKPYVISIDYKPFYEVNIPPVYQRYKFYDLAISFKYSFQ